MIFASRVSSDLLPRLLRPNTYSWEYDPYENDVIENDLYQIKCNVTQKRYEQVEENFRHHFEYEKFYQDCTEHRWSNLLMYLAVVKEVIPSLTIQKHLDWSVMHRPTSYNYWWDWINFCYTIDPQELISYLQTVDKDVFDKYAEENYASHSWFISYTPSSYWWILAALQWDEEEREFEYSIRAVLNYVATKHWDNREDITLLIGEDYLSQYLWDSLTYCKDRKYVRMARKFLS